ncbi:MAG: class I SAM-dependent methyltransferase [Actinobacteria bacterium]|nr:class I SAM-dependent methyltransferase [Actinomycetota bacterium]
MPYVPADLFGEDYLYFYGGWLDDELSDAQAELLWTTLRLSEGAEVLDVPCGHGRIANRLAARGARVTGLDADAFFLERARADAAEQGVEVEYREGDMHELPWVERFDAVVNWFTSFGYFDDEGNKAWLDAARQTLKPGGRLAIDIHNRDVFMRNRVPASVVERDGDLMVDRHRFDVETGREESERWIVRGGKVRKTEYSVRSYTLTELRSLLLDVGFTAVDAVGHDGKPLTLESRRMVVVATR